MTETEAQAIAQNILRAKLKKFGFVNVEVHAGFDHDNEPALFLDAAFEPDSPLIDGAASAEALTSLRNAFRARGEERFPYIFFHHPDDERDEHASMGAIES